MSGLVRGVVANRPDVRPCPMGVPAFDLPMMLATEDER